MTKFPVDGTGRLSSEVEHPTAALTGPAGGDLTGSYPNPAVASTVVKGSSANTKLTSQAEGATGWTGVVHEAPIQLRDFLPANFVFSDQAGGGDDVGPHLQAAIDSMGDTASFPGDTSTFRGPSMFIQFGSYRLATASAPFNITRSVRIVGDNAGGWTSGTQIYVDSGQAGLVVASPWVQLEDIQLENVDGNSPSVNPLGTGGAKDGVLVGGNSFVLRNVSAEGFPRDGIRVDSSAGAGNSNLGLIDRCRAFYNGGDGLHVEGGDANVIKILGGDFENNRKWQVYEFGFLGNTYVATHVASALNAYWTYPTATTLNGAVGATDTTITLTDATKVDAAPGFVIVGSEWICYNQIAGNVLEGLIRGFYGTTPASHLSAANVVQGYGGYFGRSSTNFTLWLGCYAEGGCPSIISYPNLVIGGILGASGPDGPIPSAIAPWLGSGNSKRLRSFLTGAISATTTQAGAAYTFALTDAGTVVEGTSGSGQTFTIPPNSSVNFPIGTTIEVFQDGAGQITIAAGAGVTLRSDGSHVSTAAQYATIRLRQRAIDEWVLSGDLA